VNRLRTFHESENMAENEPYLRPYLAATAASELRPQLLVDSWLESLDELRRSAQDEPLSAPEDFFTLLALYGRLQRSREELRTGPDAEQVLRWAEEQCRDLPLSVIDSALRLFVPDKWLAEATELEESWLEGTIPQSQAMAAAENLVTDWDDLTLILTAATKRRLFGFDDTRWESARQCDAWVAEHPEVFWAASLWLQNLGASIRPDLDEVDYDWAATAEKFILLLDQVEDFEKRWRGHPDYLADQRRKFHALLAAETQPQEPYVAIREQRHRTAGEHLVAMFTGPFVEANVLAAKATGKGSPWRTLVFVSPDRKYSMETHFPTEIHPGNQVLLHFFTDRGLVAEEFVGLPVWFCGLKCTIGQGAMIQLAWQDVAESVQRLTRDDQMPTVEVCLRGHEWWLEPETPEDK
jgi:hypothetical protein